MAMYCQKCRTPLKSDTSLDELNPAAFDLLVGSTSKADRKSGVLSNLNYPQERKDLYDRTTSQSQSPIYKRNIPPPKTQDVDPSKVSNPIVANPGMSFIEITESQIMPPENSKNEKLEKAKTTNHLPNVGEESKEKSPMSWQVQRQENLFSILSSHSDIDHPICTECSSMLLTSLTARLANATRERDAYASFLKSLQQASIAQKNEEQNVQKELAELVKEEQEAYQELLHLEEEKRELENELADLEEEDRQLEREEEEFWRSRNAFNEKQHELEVDLYSLQQKYAHDQKQLERLQRTNVYNDTFYISHDGYFGTINGLRLGRLPNQNVEWAEINAAWGQTILLLQTIAERLNFSFQGFRLRPLGSTSRIEKLEYPQQSPDALRSAASRGNPNPPKVTPLDLFSSGDMPLGRLLNHRRFDQGMVAFLECLSQIGKYVERTSTSNSRDGRPGMVRTPSNAGQTLRLPYAIEGDKLWKRDQPDEVVSIKLGVGFSPDENFTKACKYVLTCCKYLLAHVSNLENVKPG